MATRSGIYARISRDPDGTELGVRRQVKDCEDLAAQRAWTVAGVYVDDDVSAFSGKPRPEYQRLLDDLAAGELDAVIAWHPDRLHRSPRELEDFIDAVEASAAQVATCTAGDVDLATADGRLMARIVGSVARKESEDKSRRLRRKHAELAEAGKISGGGRRPFGYDADRVTVRKDEAKLIRAAADRILAGDSVRSIVTDWRDRGVKTVTGAEWQATTVKRLLKSGRIAGLREHHGEIVGPAEWPAIVTADQHRRLRAILTDPSRDRRRGTARSYLLTGFVYCGRCDARMSTRPTAAGKRRYVCDPHRNGCGRCGIDADQLEQLVVDAVAYRLDTPRLGEAIARQDRQAADADEAALDELEALEARLEELAEAWAAGDITRAEWSAARAVVNRRLDDVRRQVGERRPGKVLAGLDDGGAFEKAWPGLTLDRRRAVVGALVERISIAPTTRGNNRFDESRVDLEWLA